MLSEIRTTEWMLINWGRWAHQNRGLSLNYPSIEPHERLRAKLPPDPQIGDDDALSVDRAVAELCAARPVEGEALALYYLGGRETYRGLGKKMGKHHATVAKLVDSGKMWVEGRLIGTL